MTDTVGRPRSVLSILFIAIALGPLFAMLWIGRWTWALVYLAVAVAAAFGIGFLEEAGTFSSTPVFAIFTRADAVSLIGQALIGSIHALALRRASLGRPWYRWIAAVPALLYIVAVVLIIPARALLLQPFSIPSSSLFPTLVPGDYVLVSKTAYGYSRFSFPFNIASFDGRIWGGAPERGDLAVFKLPSDGRTDYVKRVIGLPGDHVQMVGGTLVINGAPVPRVQVEVPEAYRSNDNTTFWREMLPNGRSYVVANSEDDGPADNTDEFIVPEGQYFVMGDNRDNSVDSRFPDQLGTVPLDNFIGPVSLLLFNTEGMPTDNRPK